MLYGELPSCGQRLLWSQNSTPLQEMSPLRGGQQAAGGPCTVMSGWRPKGRAEG